MWLMANLKTIAAVILTLGISLGLHSISMSLAGAAKERALREQKTLLVEGCKKAQEHNQEVSNGLQNQIKAINTRHADAVGKLLKHEAGKCMLRESPLGHDAAAPGNGLPNAVAVLDLGAAAERQTQQLIACQEFVKGLK